MDNTFKRQLPYRYEFRVDELDKIKACNDMHGFAVVKEVLTPEWVDRLKNSILEIMAPALCQTEYDLLNPEIIDKLKDNQDTIEPLPREVMTYTMMSFHKKSDTLKDVVKYEPYMRIVRALYGNEPFAFTGSAAIYKKTGCPPGGWHTDWEPVLNNVGGCSNWFYLTGSHPGRGGLALIPDSHVEDWPGPDGFVLTANRRSFHRIGDTPSIYYQFDFPEMLPLYTEPGDLVIFAERTFHGVFPHQGSEPRISCGINFRPGVEAK